MRKLNVDLILPNILQHGRGSLRILSTKNGTTERLIILPNNGSGPCHGDSGGPVICRGYSVNRKIENVLAGVISSGKRGVDCGEGSMFIAGVSDNLEFILNVTEIPEVVSGIHSLYLFLIMYIHKIVFHIISVQVRVINYRNLSISK